MAGSSTPATPSAVLDTSVLLARSRHWLWSAARQGYYEGYWSTFIVAELVRIRTEQGITRQVPRVDYRRRINTLIHELSAVLHVANYRDVPVSGALPDPDDEPILAAALAAGAGFVVSLNTRDFPPSGEIMGVRYVTPQAFMAELEAIYPDSSLTGGGLGDRLP